MHASRRLLPLNFALLALAFWLPGCASTPPPASGKRGIERAEAEFARGDAAAALTSAESVLTLGGANLAPAQANRAHLIAADSSLALGRFSSATTHYRQAATTSKTAAARARVARGLGDVRYRQRDFAGALAQYKLALGQAQEPDQEREIYYRLAVCSRQLGQEIEGRAYLARAAGYTPSPRDPLVWDAAIGAGAPRSMASTTPWPQSVSNSSSYDERASPRSASDATVSMSWSGRKPSIHPRSAWNAKSTRVNSAPIGRVDTITIHHSGEKFESTSQAEAAKAIGGMQRFHQQSRGWADIGYHFIIDPAGRVWEGRPVNVRGAHAGNQEANEGNIGIVLIGNFNVQQPNAAQIKSLAETVGWLRSTYSVASSNVKTHNEVRKDVGAGTECPGTNLAMVVEQLRTSSATKLYAGARTSGVYQVRRGDTIYSISRASGVSPSQLLSANPGINAGSLKAGTSLSIPQ